jgi:hypothetical protein
MYPKLLIREDVFKPGAPISELSGLDHLICPFTDESLKTPFVTGNSPYDAVVGDNQHLLLKVTIKEVQTVNK